MKFTPRQERFLDNFAKSQNAIIISEVLDAMIDDIYDRRFRINGKELTTDEATAIATTFQQLKQELLVRGQKEGKGVDNIQYE